GESADCPAPAGKRLALDLDRRVLIESDRPAKRPVGFVDAWAFPPSAGLVALAAHPYENAPALGSLRFVALPSLRLVRRTVRLGGTARALLWGRPDRIVALVQDCCANTSWIATIDIGSRRVLSRQPLDGVVSTIARTGDA